MVDVELGSDEKLIRKIERIIISGVRHEVFLTDKRLIIAESESGKIRRDAEYPQVLVAILGTNRLREPEISVTFTIPGGETVTDDLVFVHLPGGQNINAADRCMEILRGHGVGTQATASRSDMTSPTRITMGDAGPSGKGMAAARQVTPDYSPIGTPYSRKQVQPEEKESKMPSAMTIGAAVLAVIVVIAVLAMAGQVLGPKTVDVGPPQPEMPPPVGTTPIVITPIPPVTAAAPEPVVTTLPVPQSTEPAIPQVITIPENGVWLHITSPSAYIGDIKAGGWTSTINTTGTYLIQIAAENTLIEGSVEKTDGGGNPMEVKIYNGGEPVFTASTTKPFGTIEIRQEIGTAIMKNPVATPAPAQVVAAAPTPDPSVALKPVPANGTYVRVTYNGPFSGSITANGQSRLVSGSGDQFFQFSLGGGGQIDGFMEKPDGSDRPLVVQVYRDGSLVTSAGTTKPTGVVEFHTVV